MRAGSAAGVDGDSIHNLPVNSCFETAQPNVSRLMVAAASGASRPVDRERIHAAPQFALEILRESGRLALRFNESEIAIIRANASDQSAREWRGTRRELLEKRFFQKRGQAIRRNIRNDGVLSDRQTNFAVPIDVCQARELVELFRVHSAGRNAKPHRRKIRLLLGTHTHMVGVRGTAHISALEGELMAEARDKFRTQAAKAPLLDQKSKATLGARFPRAEIAVNLGEFHHHRGGLKDFHEYIQRRSDCKSSRAHLTAHHPLHSEPPSLLRGTAD